MATYGLRTKTAGGLSQIQFTTRLPRRIGELVTGLSDGSVTVPEFAGRAPVYQLSAVAGTSIGFTMVPIISIVGTTLSWTFDMPAAYRASARVTYGVLG